jgi:hypothetical protein
MIDLLKLTDETDLDILNRSMEVMVEAFQTELLPVAAQLAARLVRLSFFWLVVFEFDFDWYLMYSVNHPSAGEGESRAGRSGGTKWG